jgi:hypothetical protein
MSEPTAKANGMLVGWAALANGNSPRDTLITASDGGAHTYTTHTAVVDPQNPIGFRLELPPGTYLVKADSADGFLTAEQTNVVIKPNAQTEVSLTLKPKPPK